MTHDRSLGQGMICEEVDPTWGAGMRLSSRGRRFADRFVDLGDCVESGESLFPCGLPQLGHYRRSTGATTRTHSFHEVCLAYSGEGRFNSYPPVRRPSRARCSSHDPRRRPRYESSRAFEWGGFGGRGRERDKGRGNIRILVGGEGLGKEDMEVGGAPSGSAFSWASTFRPGTDDLYCVRG